MKTCMYCGEEKPLDYFVKDKKSQGGRSNQCKDCRSEYRRARESGGIVGTRFDPFEQPDPSPAARLRVALEEQRDLDRPWSSAWPIALNIALRNLTPPEMAAWRRALGETRFVWEAAYLGQEAPGHVFRLSSDMFTDDGERAEVELVA